MREVAHDKVAVTNSIISLQRPLRTPDSSSKTPELDPFPISKSPDVAKHLSSRSHELFQKVSSRTPEPSQSSSGRTADINECGLPSIPPPPPIPPPGHFTRTLSLGPSQHNGDKHRRQLPRSSIRRSIRKFHWSDVNNNAGETMKSQGESVYF